MREHSAYVAALRNAGVEVSVLPPLENSPDSLFVEDPALVFSEGAILLTTSCPSRAGEASELAPTLRQYFDPVFETSLRCSAEGGDILTTRDKVIIGLSARTSLAGATEIVALLERLGRSAQIAQTPAGVLHFKTDCALIDEDCVLTTERLARSDVFDGFDEVIVPHGEEAAANALRVNDVVFVGSEYPRTLELLDRRGFLVVPLETTEIAKIDAGLSCMSLRWHAAT